jgi:hypothetical protein
VNLGFIVSVDVIEVQAHVESEALIGAAGGIYIAPKLIY